MEALKSRTRDLAERHGRRALVVLAAILALGFGLRAYRVVEPLPTPGDDAHAYYGLAKALYTEGTYGGPEFHDASDWSPGAPLLYAAAFYATGGAREGTARIVELLLGMATIVLVYMLGRRIAYAFCHPRGDKRQLRGPEVAGLVAALGVAVYPPFVHSVGALYSEPLAMATLPAAILLFLRATTQGPAPSEPGPSRHPRLEWFAMGLLFGVTAMARPEYLAVAGAFVLLAGIWTWRNSDWKPGITAAILVLVGVTLPIAPWTVRNIVVLDRAVTISTGGGKALYVGTYLPADGEYQRVKALLLEKYDGRSLDPNSQALEEVNPVPLFNQVAEERHPDLPRDQALGKVGKEDFSKYFDEDPSGYLAMTARKVGRMWSSGIAEAMSSPVGRGLQMLLVALGLAGFWVLGRRRRWWDLIALGTPIAIVTAVGAATLAAPRRNEVLMTLVFPLVGVALARAGGALSSRGSWRSPSPASSPPN